MPVVARELYPEDWDEERVRKLTIPFRSQVSWKFDGSDQIAVFDYLDRFEGILLEDSAFAVGPYVHRLALLTLDGGARYWYINSSPWAVKDGVPAADAQGHWLRPTFPEFKKQLLSAFQVPRAYLQGQLHQLSFVLGVSEPMCYWTKFINVAKVYHGADNVSHIREEFLSSISDGHVRRQLMRETQGDNVSLENIFTAFRSIVNAMVLDRSFRMPQPVAWDQTTDMCPPDAPLVHCVKRGKRGHH
uniref:Uncharacterized protein n=1 Tax=Chlamydomonas chlamydogama TaxID=225041 RepID=A0A7S2QSV4_9CHLO|mmetsp:Transcript_1292/g.2806  ORF Transcript_1292/g.2806 Transcript_1292/m.2806 type:complete len:245 (+) Transcript_1292:527-1261(+)